MSNPFDRGRRSFLKRSAAAGSVVLSGLPSILRAQQAPGVIAAARQAPAWGLQIGDVLSDRAIVWSRSDKPLRSWSGACARPVSNRSARSNSPTRYEACASVRRTQSANMSREGWISVVMDSSNRLAGWALPTNIYSFWRVLPTFIWPPW